MAPAAQQVQLFKPDRKGRIENVSRQEAIDRQLPIYVGKPSTLDKVWPLQGGGWGSVRYVVNGLTAGQLKWQQIVAAERGYPRINRQEN